MRRSGASQPTSLGPYHHSWALLTSAVWVLRVGDVTQELRQRFEAFGSPLVVGAERDLYPPAQVR